MATVSSHTLNGVDGTHAGGMSVTLICLGTGEMLFSTETDPGGRLIQEIDPDRIDPEATYEMVFATGPYWAGRRLPRNGPQIMTEIVLRFTMPDPACRYHMPIILSPHGYSVWWSS